MKKNRKNIAEAISRKEYGMIENELMKLIRRNYSAIMGGNKTLVDICKMVATDRPLNRDEKMEIYKMAKKCVNMVEDDMAAETNFGERRPFSYESKKRSVKLTESQIKNIIKESVRRALREGLEDVITIGSPEYGEKGFRVELSNGGLHSVMFNVYAYNEQEALDAAVDYAEENGMNGLLWDDDDTVEEYPDDFITAGNHGHSLRVDSFIVRPLNESVKRNQWYDEEDELADRKKRRSWAGDNKFHDNNEKRIKDLEAKKKCKGEECNDYEAPLKRKYFYNEPNGRPKANNKVKKFRK